MQHFGSVNKLFTWRLRTLNGLWQTSWRHCQFEIILHCLRTDIIAYAQTKLSLKPLKGLLLTILVELPDVSVKLCCFDDVCKNIALIKKIAYRIDMAHFWSTEKFIFGSI